MSRLHAVEDLAQRGRDAERGRKAGVWAPVKGLTAGQLEDAD